MKIIKVRIIVVSFFVSLCFCVLVGRLFYIQILNGDKYTTRCREQSKRRTLIPSQRGVIRDCGGRILAKSISSDGSLEEILNDNSKTRKNKKYARNSGAMSFKRFYPYGKLAGAVLGYVGRDYNGLAGAEYTFDQFLRGENGWSIIQKDGRNQHYSRIGMPNKPPKSGADVYLSINVQIQKIVEKVLSETVQALNARGGMSIVMNPVSGEILAMANVPAFDPNRWKQYPVATRNNNCISYNYEPGSTFKIVTAAAALQENVKQENDTLNGNQGLYEIYDQVIRDHKAFGNLTFSQALSYSSNVCFAKIANELGNKRLYKYTRDFGLGSGSGIFLPGEEVGIVHPVNKWSGRTRVTMAMGQEVSVTFLQMMVVFSAIANGGILVEPHVYTKIVDTDGAVIEKRDPKTKRQVISENTALRLRNMMRGVVEYGTAKRGALPGLSIGGKTGTSQKIDMETGSYSNDRVWASFIGFAPVKEPVLVCGVVIDEPSHGEGGGVAAAPAFRQILRQIISHPNLQYAEKLIGTDCPDPSPTDERIKPNDAVKKLPDMCRMGRTQAAAFLSAEKISFEIIGTDRDIAYQSPPAGTMFTDDTRLILYTGENKQDGAQPQRTGGRIRVPNCVGKDLRDAVNALNLKGLVPYVKGAGVVMHQDPMVGTMLNSAVTCTLVCSFEG